ncbi:DNA polymerase III subunit beta [Planktothrix agardhii]|jgi:DNA polymerase-3 subunit beta|uniref:Beta sliding clamp n=1 Tax=Planktothrix agardhii TaxID=1160 RepID=A0A1J1JIT4_PLAAG|nr:DNA polymerase III subunit beta [Planktothrix agardhii]BBD55294.1 DNA polymerase III beta subunit [Planktothrix agardhii NIES-204]MBG0745108.1 DNA polymerase III subunit beta [Planktothrix agardhii KL2]MCB8753216.1 DNA polymerase III subunit beta [Planktothrix agardhii 1810]MCB8760856.1 DNA polymerase III subunit beta [Planktothrix agardhii 1813]MCB8763340.1 DNA polymerase III subunit beta [Planktothrix agardhii 1809]
MKFIVEQDKLSSNLSWVSRAIPSRPNHPILSNILIDADAENQRLNLTAFDLSLGIRASMSATVTEGGTLTVPAKLFNDIVSRLPGGEITIDDEVGEAIVNLTSSSGKYQVRGMAAEEYPELPSIETGDSIHLAAESLISGLKGTLFATSSDETKQVLTGVHLKVQNNTIEFASTDGHRLAVVQTENLSETDPDEELEEFEVTVPARALREVERMVAMRTVDNHGGSKDDSPVVITLRFDESQVIFELGEQRLNTRKLEGAYPAYQQLIPHQFLNQINLDRRGFIGALERIAVLASQKNDIVKCSIDHVNQIIALSVEAADVGNALESLPAQISGDEPKELAFNVKYLLEGLKVFNTSEVSLQLNAATTPVIVNPLGGIKMTYLVMPVQLRN